MLYGLSYVHVIEFTEYEILFNKLIFIKSFLDVNTTIKRFYVIHCGTEYSGWIHFIVTKGVHLN